jgi:hypothetical protein
MDTECEIWTGSVGTHGYGLVYVDGKQRLAHRVAYGEDLILEGWQIDHLCRVILCVRRDHLEAVPPAENIRRATPYRKTRTRTHCKNGHEITPTSHMIRVQDGAEAFRCLVCDREKTARYKARRALP